MSTQPAIQLLLSFNHTINKMWSHKSKRAVILTTQHTYYIRTNRENKEKIWGENGKQN